MSKIKQQNPSIDFGFYATVPRVVRTNYRDKVTPIMKWLYTCLKDLCGDDGTCYRTLRVLSEETGISTGLLSESIPILHEVGLIHAEKKKRSTGGKEVWHITIVDIWIANGKAHPTKRSHYEQTQASENVHDTNVHNVNETTGECSCGERECSQILDRRKNTLSKNITEERTEDTISHVSIDNATLTQLQNENASLKARLEQVLSEINNARNPGGNDTPPSDIPLTPAGRTTEIGENHASRNHIDYQPDSTLHHHSDTQHSHAVLGDNHPVESDTPQVITTADGGNSPSLAQTPIDHTAISEPPCSATDGLVQESPTMPCSETTPVESPLQTQEMPLSVPAHDESSNQATKQGQQANGDDPIASGATKKARGGRGKSKEKPIIDEVTQKRIDHVYEYFDGLKREVSGKPDARYRRTDSDAAAIIEWLGSDPKPTEEILHDVYLRLWNTPPDKRSGFSWKRNMWIHSVLKQYEVLEMEIVDERNKQAKRNVVTPGVKSTFVPPPEEEDEMPFVRPSELYSRKRG